MISLSHCWLLIDFTDENVPQEQEGMEEKQTKPHPKKHKKFDRDDIVW